MRARAEGLRAALSPVVPLALFLTAIVLFIAAKTFGTDRDEIAAARLAVQATPA